MKLKRTLILAAVLSGILAQRLAAQNDEPPVEEAEPLSPLAAAVLEAQPTTPEQILRAARVLIDLGHFAEAQTLLRDFLASQPDQATLVALAERFGRPTFIQLQLDARIAPEGRELASAVLAAWHEELADPQKIAERIEQLSEGQLRGQRRAAIARLRSAGPAAVPALLAALTDPDHAAVHATIRDILVSMGSDLRAPLVAALRADDPRLRVEAANLLARLGERNASAYLLAAWASSSDDADRHALQRIIEQLTDRMPESPQAAAMLYQTAQQIIDSAAAVASVAPAEAILWRWDAPSQSLVSEPSDSRRAVLHDVLFLAQAAHKLRPHDRRIRRLYTATQFELSWTEAPPADGSEDAAAEHLLDDPQLVADVLTQALEESNVAAARAALAQLRRVGSVAMLEAYGPKPTPLIAALRHPSPDIRFEALQTILTLEPRTPFAGSSLVAPMLEHFLAARGSSRAVVADPRAHEASRIAGLLAALGYNVEIATDGHRLMELATESADVELVVLGMGLDRPSTAETLETLRLDSRTAYVPVALVAEDHQRSAAQWLAAHDVRAEALGTPPSYEALEFMTRGLRHVASRDLAGRADRIEYARQSLAWINDLLTAGRSSLYDLNRLDETLARAVYRPELSAGAIEALARLDTRRAQQALVELASREMQPLEVRQAAVAAFRQSVGQRGILLTSDELWRQYDLYNASEHEEVTTQQVLAAILDTLERRDDATPPTQ